MAERKKPIGAGYSIFYGRWALADHAGKIALAKEHGVTYDTAKHWYSEGDTTPTEVASSSETLGEEMVGEVLATQARVELDFISFDIETTNLTADFSVMLTACIKPFGEKPMIWRADDYPEWEKQRANDVGIVTDVSRELGRHAVVVTHYGTGFDIPYMRAKMVRYGLPSLPPMFGLDTYSIAKRNFRVSRRRLAALAEYFELGKKEGVKGNLWMEAGMNGSREAMDAIVKHNIVDCEVLERLAAISFPYLKSMRRL